MHKRWFVFADAKLLVMPVDERTCTIPEGETPPLPDTPLHEPLKMGEDGGTEVMTYEIAMPGQLPPGMEMAGLRSTFGRLPHRLYAIAGKCREMNHWNANTQYCGACGGKTRPHTAISKQCAACGREIWPQPSAAVICLIENGDRILLVRPHNFRSRLYGLVAGFVEPGENLEEALRREVMEETALRIKNITYAGSQAWPFPFGLMAGYTAEYDGGELHPQESELADARWFDADHLPDIPDKASIARRLIDRWLDKRKAASHEDH